MLTQYFDQNTLGRDFVCGDIHGCFPLLEQALTLVQFDSHRDRLFLLGDLVDRGPQSHRCAEFLARPGVFSVMGNHEAMLLEAQHLPASVLLETEHSWALAMEPDDLEQLLTAIAKLPLVITVDTVAGPVGLIHAEPLGNATWSDTVTLINSNLPSAINQALWGRDRINGRELPPVAGVSRVFAGHSIVPFGSKVVDNVVYLDTGGILRHWASPDLANTPAGLKFCLTLAELTCPLDMLNQELNAPSAVQCLLADGTRLTA